MIEQSISAICVQRGFLATTDVGRAEEEDEGPQFTTFREDEQRGIGQGGCGDASRIALVTLFRDQGLYSTCNFFLAGVKGHTVTVCSGVSTLA